MKVVEAVSEILQLDAIGCIIGYPVNHVLEYAAHYNIRPIIVPHERIPILSILLNNFSMAIELKVEPYPLRSTAL